MTSDATTVDCKRGLDYIGVTVIFLCHDGNGRILLQKRSMNCRDEQGRWDCGGGAMEFGETFEEAVQREVREEYGTTPITVRRLATHNILRDHGDRRTHWVAVTHTVLVDPSTVTIGDPDKIDEIGWFTLDTLPSPMHSHISKDLDAVREAGIL